MRAQAYLLAALLATLTTAGCAEYHYYDIDVSFNIAPPMNFMGTSDVSTIQNCVVEVRGADSGDFLLRADENCPPRSPAGSPQSHMGVFEYSSTADSGALTFTFKAYVGPAVPECLAGQGATTINVGATTVTGTLKVDRINDRISCQ